ncbi:MAG: hypothetical protein WKF56_02690 [Candidatus Limnocylindrales bacterium]
MTTIECPWCDGPLEVDEVLSQVACGECQVTVIVAADGPGRPVLDVAA